MSDAITRLNAALEGRYAIERELGEGGMATVYLADDVKHERKVALKVLKPELAAVVGAERFLAEIKTTANLTHPHILPLFDSGEADSFLFYVMPHIEGESLRERIDREKQLPVDEAVKIATDLAEALDYAHRHKIIHRDIKPANILMHEGRPLIADFGIALAVGVAGGGRLTETGLSVGTPHYMSPEQATGDQAVGVATDIYALGAVLYEMLVGDPPYMGSTAQAILGRIIAGKVASASEERTSVPANVDAAIRKALEKLPADRFTGAQEFAGALADPGFRHGELDEAAVVAGVGPWKRLTVGFAGLAALFAIGFGWSLLRPEPSQLVSRFVMNPPPGVEIAGGPNLIQGFAVSPDGRTVVFPDGPTGQLYRQDLDELDAVPIPGAERVWYPFFSPDGEWVAYFDQGNQALRKIRLDGSSQAVTLVPVSGTSRSAGWGADGTIVLAAGDLDGLWRVRDTGGELELIANTGGSLLLWLDLLPNGRGVLAQTNSVSGPEVVAVSLETGERTVLFAGTTPRYVATGHVVFWRESALWAAEFDSERLEVLGPLTPIVPRVAVGGNNLAHFAVGGDLLFYQEGSSAAAPGGAQQQLLTVDLEGNEEALVLAPRPIQSVGWSPDDQSVVYSSEGHIYTYDVELGTTPVPLTVEGNNTRPVFSPDGTQVAFSSVRNGTDGVDLWVKTLDDDAPARSIIRLEGDQRLTQWPLDTLLVFEQRPNPSDLWMVNLSDPDSATAEVYLPLEADLDHIKVSPDGTLAAYTSDESGREEVYIRSFPDPGEGTLVSEGLAEYPFWSPDGDIVYYWRDDGPVSTFMAVRIQRGPTPGVLSRDSLFTGAYNRIRSDLHPGGDRVVVAQDVGTASALEGAPEPGRFIMVTNFFEELRQRLEN